MAELFEDTSRGADLSDCRLYRYNLWRRWAVDGPSMGFVMLNPSTADHLVDDATIRRCCGFARRERCAGIVVRNLFAFRTAYPKELSEAAKAGVDVVGPDNDEWIRRLAEHPFEVHPVVAAWGAMSGLGRHVDTQARTAFVEDLLHRRLKRFAVAKPSPVAPHPLYLAGTTPLEELSR